MRLTKDPELTMGHWLKTSHIYLFINGFLLASLLYFYVEDSYEKEVFDTLAGYVKQKSAASKDPNSNLLESMHLTHYLAASRNIIFKDKETHSLKSNVIHPVTYDLMTTSCACGSYAYILSRLLNELNINNRIAQMEVNGEYGKHMIVEAETSKGWVVLDASYDLYFKKADGTPASFVNVETNWNYYKKQLSPDYDTTYNYQGVRYTNWSKIPVLMPLLHQALYLILGKEKTDAISIRTLTLRKYHLLFQVTLSFYILLMLIMTRKTISRIGKTSVNYLQNLFLFRKKTTAQLRALA